MLDFEPGTIGFWAIVCQVKYPVLFLSGKASSTALSARDPVSLSESRRKLGSASKPKLPNKAGSKISGRGIKNRRLNGWRPAPGEAQEPRRQSESEPSCRHPEVIRFLRRTASNVWASSTAEVSGYLISRCLLPVASYRAQLKRVTLQPSV